MFLFLFALFLAIFIIHKFILAPYFLIRYYKNQGINHIFFMPVMGFYYYVLKSYYTKGDALFFLKDYTKKHPDVDLILFNLWDKILFLVIDVNLIKDLSLLSSELASNHDYTFDPLGGKCNLLFSENEDWKKRRRMHSQAFADENIKKMTPEIIITTNKFINEILTKENLKSVNMVFYFQEMVGEFIQKSLIGSKEMMNFGINGKSLTSILMIYMGVCFNRFKSLMFAIFGKKYYDYIFFGQEYENNKKIKFFKENLKHEINLLINERKEQRKIGKEYDNKLINFYIDYIIDNKNCNDIDLTNEFIAILIAGIETTSYLLLYTLMNLSVRKDIISNLREEINKNIINEDEISFLDLNKMNLLNAIIKETLRLKSPAPFGLIKIAQNTIKLGKYQFKKGSNFMMCMIANNLNEKYFYQPNEFIPERWINNEALNLELSNPFIYIPFSIGRRNCIGQNVAKIEAKIILIKIVKSFDFKIKNKSSFNYMFTPSYKPDESVLFELVTIK